MPLPIVSDDAVSNQVQPASLRRRFALVAQQRKLESAVFLNDCIVWCRQTAAQPNVRLRQLTHRVWLAIGKALPAKKR